jgi:hypothetical protein
MQPVLTVGFRFRNDAVFLAEKCGENLEEKRCGVKAPLLNEILEKNS